jgi:hypothetical protein
MDSVSPISYLLKHNASDSSRKGVSMNEGIEPEFVGIITA